MGRNFIYIDQEFELKNLIKDLQAEEKVYLDTEADSLHHYYEKVCLIQLSFSGRDFIIDPLSDITLSRFLEILSKKTLVLHGADFDLRMLFRSYGFRPKKPIFDTMLAAQLLGLPQIGLAALVEKFCDIKLSKKGQKSNWGIRPLTPEQLVYASNDTYYLKTVSDELAAGLQSLGRKGWHEEWCAKIVDLACRKQARTAEETWRIKGSGALDSKILNYLKELWAWRENEAKKFDRPAFMVLGNAQIIELVKWLADNPKGALQKGPKLPKNCRGSRLKALEQAIHKARHLPKEKWPEKRKKIRKDEPNCDEELDLLRLECKKLAEGLKIEPSILAPKQALKNIVLGEPKTLDKIKKISGLMEWQSELIYPAVQKVISDRNELVN